MPHGLNKTVLPDACFLGKLTAYAVFIRLAGEHALNQSR
jgi:hypothetical protein